MILNTEQIEAVRSYLLHNGLTIPEVFDDVADHLCCHIEDRLRAGYSYDEAFASATELIAPAEVMEIHQDTIYYLTIKSQLMMVKSIFITAFLSVFFFVLGYATFYVLAAVQVDYELATMLRYLVSTLGLLIFCFGFLPSIFLFGYRRFVTVLQQ